MNKAFVLAAVLAAAFTAPVFADDAAVDCKMADNAGKACKMDDGKDGTCQAEECKAVEAAAQ